MARLLNTDQNAYPVAIRDKWARAVTELGAFIRELNTSERRGNAARTEALNRVNARLGSVRFALQLVRTPNGLKRSLLPAIWDGDAKDQTVPLGLAMITDLAATGELAKLRDCDYCEKWFLASRNRSDARFCNQGCQKRWHRKTEHGREKQKGYTAKSRRLKKEMLEAQLRATRRLAQKRKPGRA